MMRRTLLLDIPRNVTSREYAIYSLQWGLVFFGLAAAAGTLLASIRGDAHRAVAALEAIPSIAVADAAGQSKEIALVRIEGTLAGETSAAMPDDPGVEVVLGWIELVAKSTEGGGGSREAVLHRWEHVPDSMSLSAGNAEIQLEVEPKLIPRGRASMVGRPERLTDGGSPRLSRTVGYRYLQRDWPLPEEWGAVRSASARVERSYVEVGAPFVAAGRLVPREGGAVLVVDEASGGGVYAGTLEEIIESSERLGSRLRFAWIPLLLGAFWFLRIVLRKRREFVKRSNLP